MASEIDRDCLYSNPGSFQKLCTRHIKTANSNCFFHFLFFTWHVYLFMLSGWSRAKRLKCPLLHRTSATGIVALAQPHLGGLEALSVCLRDGCLAGVVRRCTAILISRAWILLSATGNKTADGAFAFGDKTLGIWIETCGSAKRSPSAAPGPSCIIR